MAANVTAALRRVNAIANRLQVDISMTGWLDADQQALRLIGMPPGRCEPGAPNRSDTNETNTVDRYRSMLLPIAPPMHPFGPRRVSVCQSQTRRTVVSANSAIREHMEVIGADGVHIGTVDKVENGRIKLTKKDSGEGRHRGHHHYISTALVAETEGNKVRLSANADVAVTFEEEGKAG
jgi:hypothetical protein